MPVYVLCAVLFSALLHAGWNAVLRSSPDRGLTVAWIGLATFLISGPLALYYGFPFKAWPFVLASSALHLAYLVLLAQAYKLSELSFAYPIARGSSPMLVAVGGVLFAAERPSVEGWIGIGLIVAGILVIGLESKSWDAKGLGLALSIGAIIGVYTVLDALGARVSSSSTQYNVCEFTIYGIGVAVMQLATRGKTAFSGPSKSIALGFLGGAASIVAYAIVVWGMVQTHMGSVSAIRETSTLFAALIAWLFLKERFSLQKVIGSCTVVAGAAFIGLSR